MFFPLLFLCSIPCVITLSSQEDLSITKYSQIGCLKFKPDKQFLVTHTHESPLSSYQTFSSPSMTVELCFRLCRRWFILISNNQTNCLCLYTIDKTYELKEYLGQFSSTDNCKSDDVEVYSLTDDITTFPPLSASASDDWSLDGCYYLHGIQNVRVSLWLNHVDYIEAIDLCRKHCQTNQKENFYSYFLSRKKSCYCAPLNFAQTAKTVALRKPLIQCSFHPYVCPGFTSPCEKYYSDTSADTLMRIDVRHYCSSNESNSSFVFDGTFYRCFDSLPLQAQTNFATINEEQNCLPLSIETIEQWKHLIQSSWITYSKLFISIDRNSTYILNDLFKNSNLTLSNDNLCIVISRTQSNEISYEMIQCAKVRLPGNVLCAQKPLQSTISREEEFRMINNESQTAHYEALSCPSGFVLFNKMCYYIHLSLIYNAQIGESSCYEQNSNSTLVKFGSHEWGNINATKFLGRTYNDLLLEFFYYLLEKKLREQTIDPANRKNWLKLLLGDRNDPKECILRYFARASGSFTVFQRCNTGGHPVCQCEPIRTEIIPDRTSSSIQTNIIESTTPIISFDFQDLSTTVVPNCKNCTTAVPAEEILLTREVIIDRDLANDTLVEVTDASTTKKYFTSRPFLVILTGPGLALLIFIAGIALLIRHLRKSHPSYSFSARSSLVDTRRTKRSSTTLTVGEIPSVPALSANSIRLARVSFSDSDMLLPLNNSVGSNGETIELLPATKVQILGDENRINESNEETVQTTLN